MPLGIDPHAFEPSPRDIAHIADSTVLVINGAASRDGWRRHWKTRGGSVR